MLPIFQILLFFGLMLSGCFGAGIEKRGSVYGYENGRVKTVGGDFYVGTLPPDWQIQRIRARAVLFRNKLDASTITVSSWCGRAAEEDSQADLSRKVVQVVRGGTVHWSAKEVQLAFGTASETLVTGEMDGETVRVRSVVIKRQGCVFDFLHVTHPEQTAHEGDFDALVRGFRTGKQPYSL